MGLKLKGLFAPEESSKEDEYYTISAEDALKGIEGEGSKLILLEPRAYSESQQIADHLKNRHTVVVNLNRWRFTKNRWWNFLMYTKKYERSR